MFEKEVGDMLVTPSALIAGFTKCTWLCWDLSSTSNCLCFVSFLVGKNGPIADSQFENVEII